MRNASRTCCGVLRCSIRSRRVPSNLRQLPPWHKEIMMQAAIFYAPGDVRFEDIATPEPGPGEVLVRIRRALTCGTDLKTYRRGHPTIMQRVPTPFGHEFAGDIAA